MSVNVPVTSSGSSFGSSPSGNFGGFGGQAGFGGFNGGFGFPGFGGFGSQEGFGGFNGFNGSNSSFGGNYGAPFGGFSGNFGGFNGANSLNGFSGLGGFNGNYGAVAPYGYGFPGFSGNFGGFNNSLAPFGGFNGFNSSFFNRAFNDLEKTFSSELNLQPSRPASLLEHYSMTNPIRYDADGNRWFNCYFDLRSYKPEEVSVTLDTKNRFINVEATHEVKDNKDHYIKRSYSRKVYVPEDLKIDLSKIELKSSLTNNGLLLVEAALPKLSLEEARTATAGGKSLTSYEPNVYKVATKTI